MKKLQHIVLSFCLILGLFWYPNMIASAASVSLGLSASEVNIGDTVTVSVTVPESISATIDLSFSSGILSFSSASADVNANGSTVRMNVGKYSMAGTKTVSVTFKANTSGSAGIKASVISAVDNSTAEEVSLEGASVVVSVANQVQEPADTPANTPSDTTEQPKSPDNSLASLKLSAGTLSPSFQYNVTNYTATVPYNTDKVVVSATPSNGKAVIESVTGNGTVGLQVGKNTIQIVVVAENGVKATYTVVVTRLAEEVNEPNQSDNEPEDVPTDTPADAPENETSENETQESAFIFSWNGVGLNPAEGIPQEAVLDDFSLGTITVNSIEMPCLTFANTDMVVLYLMDEEGTVEYYIYEEETQAVYPLIKLLSENGYLMVLNLDETSMPSTENYTTCTLSIEGKGIIQAYQFVSDSETDSTATDFYLIYGMNNLGEKGWYLYDAAEGTYQRYFGLSLVPNETTDEVPKDTEETKENEKLLAQLDQAEQNQTVILCVAALIVIILIIVIISLKLKNRAKSEEEELEEYEEYEKYEAYKNEEEKTEYEEANTLEERILKDAMDKLPEMSDEEKTQEPEDESEEVEVEFYEMPDEEKAEEPEDKSEEVEVEFYEMPDEEKAKEPEDELEEVEVGFYEMPDETEEVESALDENKNEIEESDASVSEDIESETMDEEDDDLEFIDLD